MSRLYVKEFSFDKHFCIKCTIYQKLSLLDCMPCVPCHAMATWSMCQWACMPVWITCQRACMPKCQKRSNFTFLPANKPINMPMCSRACHCFNLACQFAKRLANFSTWHANVPKGMPIFQIFPLWNAKENVFTILLKCLEFLFFSVFFFFFFFFWLLFEIKI